MGPVGIPAGEPTELLSREIPAGSPRAASLRNSGTTGEPGLIPSASRAPSPWLVQG